MRWSIDELLSELASDADRRILFVEGLSDLALWRGIVPEAERQNTVVYPIGVVEIECASGGARGRLFACANVFLDKGLNDRVHFFADADFDRLLGRGVPHNITLTDGRDRESYLLLGDGLEKICLSAANPAEKAAGLATFLRQTARPIGELRFVSETEALSLPFQKTLDGRMKRYVSVREGSFHAESLLRALLQNCSIGLGRLEEVLEAVREKAEMFARIPDHELVHGKDMASLTAAFMAWGSDESDTIVSLALVASSNYIREMPNVARVRAWVASPLLHAANDVEAGGVRVSERLFGAA